MIASYYTDSVTNKTGCPARIIADLGTENGHVCQMQSALRRDHDDQFAKKSFIYGSSNHNQRIKCWWSFLRTHQAQYWMDLFQGLKDSNYLCKSLVHAFIMSRLDYANALLAGLPLKHLKIQNIEYRTSLPGPNISDRQRHKANNPSELPGSLH